MSPRQFYIRGKDTTPVLLSAEEYVFRFFLDSIRKDGEIIGYVHPFHDEYVVVLKNLRSLCFTSSVERGREILLKYYNISD